VSRINASEISKNYSGLELCTRMIITKKLIPYFGAILLKPFQIFWINYLLLFLIKWLYQLNGLNGLFFFWIRQVSYVKGVYKDGAINLMPEYNA
jgi:hypothetical protein